MANKKNSKVIRFILHPSAITFRRLGLDKNLNILSAPLCECGCGGKMDVILKSEQDISDFCGSMVYEQECSNCAVFAIRLDGTMIFAFSEPNCDDIGISIAKWRKADGEYEFHEFIRGLNEDIQFHCYGVIVEVEPGIFKILEN